MVGTKGGQQMASGEEEGRHVFSKLKLKMSIDEGVNRAIGTFLLIERRRTCDIRASSSSVWA